MSQDLVHIYLYVHVRFCDLWFGARSRWYIQLQVARCNFMPSSEQIRNFCSGVDVSIAQVSWSKWNHFYFLGLRIQPNSQGLINYVLGLKIFQSQPRIVLGFGVHPCLTVTDCSAASNLNDKRRSALTRKYLADIILMCHDLLQNCYVADY